MHLDDLTPLYKPYRRMYDGPIEADSTFETLDEANLYVATEPSYDGQLISITTGNDAGLYMVLKGTLHGVPFTHKIRDLIPNIGGGGGTVIPPAAEIKISKKSDNALELVADGLYVKKVVVPPTTGTTEPGGGTVIPPAVSTIKKYTKNIGDGINKQINVNHNLNTQDITFSVWTRTLPPEYVVCDVIILSENTIQLLFEKVPTPDQYRVVVMG